MSERPDPELIDEENPPWTAERVTGAMRFQDLPAELQATLKPCGRPKAAATKA